MEGHALPYLVNCSIIFTELPLLERPAAARAAGFDAIELWWPFATAAPTTDEVDALVGAVQDAGVALVCMNLFAGDMPGGDRGIVSWPGREGDFADCLKVAVDMGEALGIRGFNALYGNRHQGTDPAAQDAAALANLTRAAEALGAINATVLIEPLSGVPAYPLRTADDVMGVIHAARHATGAPNLALLADLYHLATNDDDVTRAIAAHTPDVGHVQIADVPGRHEPGTGDLDLQGWLSQLEEHGYAGWVGLEYAPLTTSEESFAWLPVARRSDMGGKGAA